ncbi:hypothetical protein ASPFODRAFT_218903 [Aspergillus luchuensis CBS 106.47]|uniref:Zn(2)-C6 fungal-type domain-containing protein n=1 Tax=Aspergillus luchuensis (strain CBS 106.47) TaxID=1137211 RepID=A0A1M3TG22_ASPLC|nr:hypothetical protein ASPFODRAFT_218903 [Aspergillus luchuensis CBS 106.47]
MVGETETERVKTCENCVRAKIRCTHAPDATICDRCYRLKKECYFRLARQRSAPKKRRRNRRIEMLEDKVDQIMGQINLVTPRRPEHPYHTPNSEVSSTYPHADTIDVIKNGLISHESATQLLDQYREAMLFFPFVMVPASTTVDDLRAEKPFVLLCILVFCSFHDDTLQKSLEEVLQSYVSNEVLCSEHDSHPPSFEILQGLLIILAGTRQRHQLCRFPYYMQLAVGVVINERLDRHPKYRVATRLEVGDECDETRRGTVADESRALIGLFLLNSTDAIIRQKTCTTPWTPFIESIAEDLSRVAEYPTDRYIIYYVQLQHMLQRFDALTMTSIERHPDMEQHIRAFRAEVEQYKNQLPVDPTCDPFIATQYHTLELQICQISLIDTKVASTPSDSFLLVSRSDTLCHGLAASKRFLDYYLKLPPVIERNYSIVIWLSSGFLVAAACKLVLAALHPSLRLNTQVQELRDALDMPKMLQFFVARLDAIAKTCKDGVFSHYHKWTLAAATWFDKAYQVAQLEAAKIVENESLRFAEQNQNMDQGIQTDPNLFGLDFDITMEELMGGWSGPLLGIGHV